MSRPRSRTATQAARDVGSRVVRAYVARRGVGDGAAAPEGGQPGPGVGRRGYAQVAAEPGQLAGVAAGLRGRRDHDRGQPQGGVGVDGADRGAAHVAGTPDRDGYRRTGVRWPGIERVLVLHGGTIAHNPDL